MCGSDDRPGEDMAGSVHSCRLARGHGGPRDTTHRAHRRVAESNGLYTYGTPSDPGYDVIVGETTWDEADLVVDRT